jgi:hypothetical protein
MIIDTVMIQIYLGHYSTPEMIAGAGQGSSIINVL